MAGTRHHIIPRFLLKGFASKVERDQTFAWVFRKGRIPFETNINNIVENDFYGKEGADEAITMAEEAEFWIRRLAAADNLDRPVGAGHAGKSSGSPNGANPISPSILRQSRYLFERASSRTLL
jgi:Protein of unknown function (DUF4238)